MKVKITPAMQSLDGPTRKFMTTEFYLKVEDEKRSAMSVTIEPGDIHLNDRYSIEFGWMNRADMERLMKSIKKAMRVRKIKVSR